MIILIGLVVLVAAVVVGVAGVLANGGGGHALTHDGFAVLGYHVTGSTGLLFFYGMVVGALGLLGLSLLLAGARRTARRGRVARRDLKQSRREAASVSRDRDDLLERQHETTPAAATMVPAGSPDGTERSDRRLGHRRTRHPFRHRPTDGNLEHAGADMKDAPKH